MWKMFSLLAVLAGCGGVQQPAAAPPEARVEAPAPRRRPEPNDTCDRTGGAVFTVATQDGKADGQGMFVRLYRGGALEIMRTNGELPPRTTVSCAHATLATVSKHVAAAAWKVTPVPACGAFSPTTTTYWTDDRKLWTSETCPKDQLDADSQKHLAAILAALQL